MSDKVISIIVPVYNAEQFIDQTIKSILAQTYSHLELILVNDGSTDRSRDIIEQWIEKDPRIVYVEQENQGPSATRNNGLNRATGDYVLFVDADDELKNAGLQQMMNSVSESDLLIFGYENHFDQEGKKNSVVRPADEGTVDLQTFLPQFGQMFKDNLIHYVWNKLYKKEVVETIRFDESVKVGEDLLFNLEAINAAGTISLKQEALYIHNWYNDDSITTKFHRELFDYRKKQFEKVRNFLIENRVYTDVNKEILEKQFFKKYLAALLTIEAADSDLTFKEKKVSISHIADVADKQSLLSYSNRSYWEKLVIFLMKHKMIIPLYLTNKALKGIQDKRRQH